MRNIKVADFFREDATGVAPQHACDIARSPDDELFFSQGIEVSEEAANGGLHLKTFGKEKKRYSVIAVTGMDAGTLVVQGAFRILHSHVHIDSFDGALSALRKFLSTFGVHVTLPGLGSDCLFYGGELGVPPTLLTDRHAMAYLYHIAEGQAAESFAMLSNFRLDHTSHVIRIHLLAFYSTDRYLRAIRTKRKPVIRRREPLPSGVDKASIRAEYKRLLMSSGYQPQCVDAEWSRSFAIECEKAGLPKPVVRAGDVVTYQRVLDQASALVEELIRQRGHELKDSVFVGEWPLGELQASVHRASQGKGALVLVNVGLMRLVHHFSKLVTNCLGFVTDNETQVSLPDHFGWPPLKWSSEEAVQYASESLAAYFIHGDCRTAPRIPLSDSHRSMFAMALTHWAEVFVVAHEYAHLLLEHDGQRVTFATPYGAFDVIGQSQRNEYDADLAAIDICLANANWASSDAGELDANVRVGGACLFFLVVLFLDGVKVGPHDFTVNINERSHPVPYCRMTNILDHLKRRYGQSPNFLGDVFRQLTFALVPPFVERARSLIEGVRQ